MTGVRTGAVKLDGGKLELLGKVAVFDLDGAVNLRNQK